MDGGEDRIEPLGAPTDPLRPTGRVEADQALAESKARMAAKGRKVLRALAIGLAAVVLLAILYFVAMALVPKPDL
jgi:hypothetical protein